ncbi:uncharacterized protein LOC143803958 [Ranitomeya variabilis]|uniref:uncharacterized protein LOC143803958 n=1 Tax=Ranitomeya variabilis TaxID=490064 RepID=UPI004056B6FA
MAESMFALLEPKAPSVRIYESRFVWLMFSEDGAAAGINIEGSGRVGRKVVPQPPKKDHIYIYMSRLNFLAPVMDLRTTESNLVETEPASEVEPANTENEEAGTAEEDAPGPSRAERAIPGSLGQLPTEQEEPPRSSSPTLPLDTSPQATTVARNIRRRREHQSQVIRRQVDSRVMDYIQRTISDDGEEAFGRSLAQHLRQIPTQLRLPTKTAILQLLTSAIPPNNPQAIFECIQRRYQTQIISQISDSSVATAGTISTASGHTQTTTDQHTQTINTGNISEHIDRHNTTTIDQTHYQQHHQLYGQHTSRPTHSYTEMPPSSAASQFLSEWYHHGPQTSFSHAYGHGQFGQQVPQHQGPLDQRRPRVSWPLENAPGWTHGPHDAYSQSQEARTQHHIPTQAHNVPLPTNTQQHSEIQTTQTPTSPATSHHSLLDL